MYRYRRIFYYIIGMDTVKMTIVNKTSLSGIPEEVIDMLTFHTLNQANEMLSDYNLKISEMENIISGGHLMEQKITFVDR